VGRCIEPKQTQRSFDSGCAQDDIRKNLPNLASYARRTGEGACAHVCILGKGPVIKPKNEGGLEAALLTTENWQLRLRGSGALAGLGHSGAAGFGLEHLLHAAFVGRRSRRHLHRQFLAGND
jgi:hypothetical protein